MTVDKSDFQVLNDDEVFVGGYGVFAINDSELHKLYPNFKSVSSMLKEIEEERERLALIKSLNELSLRALREMTKNNAMSEALERRALIEALSMLSLNQLTKEISSLN